MIRAIVSERGIPFTAAGFARMPEVCFGVPARQPIHARCCVLLESPNASRSMSMLI